MLNGFELNLNNLSNLFWNRTLLFEFFYFLILDPQHIVFGS